MEKITLQDMLDVRENRAAEKNKLLKRLGAPVVSVTINVPGPDKNLPGIRELFEDALDGLQKSFAESRIAVLEKRAEYKKTGPEALFAADADALSLKRICVRYEDECDRGRLLDIDVYRSDGTPVSRRDIGLKPRKCFLCDQDAVVCIRMGRHQGAEVMEKFGKMLYPREGGV